VLTCSFCSVVK